MRIRTIKPEFFTHEGLYELEKSTKLPIRIAFIGLWCAADREGRFKWEPRRLGISILPYDTCDFSMVLDALMTRGFIRQYRAKAAVYGCIPSFHRHQVVNNRERTSELPEPPETQDIDASSTRESGDDDAMTTPVEGKGMEGEGTGKEGGKPSATKTNKARGTLEEVIEFAVELGLPRSDGEACFHKWEGNGWKNGGAAIKDWKATVRAWKASGYLPSQKANGGKPAELPMHMRFKQV